MLDENKTIPNPENPETFTGLRLGEPADTAGGAKAVISSLKHVFGAMDAVRGLKALGRLNQFDGHDCPGCAWPDPDGHRSGIAEYCENGAKAIAEEATTKKVDAAFFAKHSVAEIASWTDYEIGKSGRLCEPMYLAPGATHYAPISWEQAFDKIAGALKKLPDPNRAVFYTSGRTSNEAAFLYQLLIRRYGTNNLPDCSNMCHESSGVALNESLGIGKGSVTLEDFYETDLILILGQNPGTNHPRMLSALQKAKANGAKIISINPLKEAGLLNFSHPQQVSGMLGASTHLTDLYLQVKINGDLALLKAIALLLLEAEDKTPGAVFDWEFIREKTQGAEAYLDDLRRYNLQELAAECGISEAQIREAAQLLLERKRVIACWAMGLTQHKNAVDTIREIVNLLLLKGSVGKPGAGTCPVRGHSNVQGDRTMGIYEKPPKAFLDNIERAFGFNPPREDGYDVVDAIKAMHAGKVDVFIAMGGNFLSATPDTLYTAQALHRCKLSVQVSTKLNRSHVICGEEALILPCLGRTDLDLLDGHRQFVSVENSMGVVHSSKGSLWPVSDQLLSEPVIVCRMAKALFGKDPQIDWDKYMTHYDRIREDIERTIPGFDDYNRRVRLQGGFYLPNGARIGQFKTGAGKAMFNVAAPLHTPLQPDEWMMMTIRTHDQFNTTIYGLHDRYRGIYNERRVVLLNKDDIAKAGFKPGDVVDLYNYHGGTERVARRFIVVEYDIPRQCAATYFPETNVLVPIDSVAEKSNTPTSKMVIIKLRNSLNAEFGMRSAE